MVNRFSSFAGALLAVAMALASGTAARADQPLPAPARAAPTPAAAPLSWTDLADLALASPVVLTASIRGADKVRQRSAMDIPSGHLRVLVRADLTAALKAPGLLPAAAAWLWQGPADARGRPPFGKTAPVLVFAAPLSGGSDPQTQPLRLISPHGQQPWTGQTEAMVRDILAQALRPGAQGLLVTAVADGFHTAGAIAGASESQFFLATEGGKPMTLVVRRQPGVPADVAVATDDLVDRAAPVAPRTLVWRGLACGLPPALPAPLAGHAELAADYALARRAIGACGRTVAPPRQGGLAPLLLTARSTG